MIDLNPSRNLASRQRIGCFLAMLTLAGLLAGPVTAQTFTTLHSFTAVDTNDANIDGAYPSGGLVLSGNTLYGTAASGGSSGNGTVFALNTDGKGFTNLHRFTTGSGFYPNFINSDGAHPNSLILTDKTIYGTAARGGSGGGGTLFSVNTDGTGFKTLYSFTGTTGSGNGNGPFTNSDGVGPQSLILSGQTLYGTTSGGGCGIGTVFKVSTDGTHFMTLYTFAYKGFGGFPSGLAQSGDKLYGTTTSVNLDGFAGGNIFIMNTNGTGFSSFLIPAGAGPFSALTLSGDTFYGTSGHSDGGAYGFVFAVRTDGTDFTRLHGFAGSEAALPSAPSLLLSGPTLYGTTLVGGGIEGDVGGSVFTVNTDGTGFEILYGFTALLNTNSDGIYTNSDGDSPYGGVMLSGKTLYGTASNGGSSGVGTVFSISLPPPRLTITPSGTNLLLTWPTNPTCLTLQSATNLVSPVWTTNSPAPVVVNGQNTMTNPASGTQQFFRLSQ